jgi:hypothetical protein
MSANVTWPVLAQIFIQRPQSRCLYSRPQSGRFDSRSQAIDSIRGGLPAVYPNHES